MLIENPTGIDFDNNDSNQLMWWDPIGTDFICNYSEEENIGAEIHACFKDGKISKVI